jgi:AAA domain
LTEPDPRLYTPNGERPGDDLSTVRTGYEAAELDWSAFWARDLTARDFHLDPLAPRGRAVTIVSKAKEGKSELSLFCAVRLALGKKALAQPPGPPTTVLYIDHEMTETDVQERLTDMGVDENTDLSHLHYVVMPGVAKLDTPEGGLALVSYVDGTGAAIVIIDTLSKIILGDEDEASTWNAYWTHTGQPLHARGVTVLALDHSGHTATRARGSSAKQAIFDVIWELTKQSNGTTLKATHRRVGWVPENVAFARKDDPVEYEANNPTPWPLGTEEAAAKLDDAGVTVNSTERAARKLLAEAGHQGATGIRNHVLRAALRWRRDPANTGARPGARSPDEGGARSGAR